MQRVMMKSKIHGAFVTGADIAYEGSITLDEELMRAADILPYEQVDVLDLDNGERLTTYAIAGQPGSGAVVINGAAAHLIKAGHRVIVIGYGIYEQSELAQAPSVVFTDDRNRPRHGENSFATTDQQGAGAR